MFIRKESQQLTGEATMPDSVISSCQIDKISTDLLLGVIKHVMRHAHQFMSLCSCVIVTQSDVSIVST